MRALIGEGATVTGCARTVSPELAGSGAHGITADLPTARRPAEVVQSALGRHGDLEWAIDGYFLLAGMIFTWLVIRQRQFRQ